MTFIYFDTNVLRYFGQAFQSTRLNASLRSRIAVSPLSVAELLAQLGGRGSIPQEAYDAIQAIRNWVDPTNAHGLDWPQEFIKEQVFGIPIPQGARLPRVFEKLNECLQSNPDLPSFRRAAEGIKRSWEKIERRSAELRRSNFLCLRHRKIKAPKDQLLKSSLKTLREIASVTETSVDREEILEKLTAYHELEISIYSIALKDHKFNFLSKSRMNDQVDIEQLLYLADDRARYLSGDETAYKRLKGTPQWPRIRIEKDPSRLRNAASATDILREMLE